MASSVECPLHVGSGLLLFALLSGCCPPGCPRLNGKSKRRFKPRSGISTLTALFLALIWMVHPVHSAAVDYISGRAEAGFFFAAGSWLLFLAARRRTSGWTRSSAIF